MMYKRLKNKVTSLSGKTVAISGATGGIGNELCMYLLHLGAALILLDRNRKKSDSLKDALLARFPNAEISQITLDLEDIETVRVACAELETLPLDAIILNAGAYSIPRHKCSTGYDNVFQINFVSPYFMARRLIPHLEKRKGRVIAVCSIAHNYSKIDVNDIDFSNRKKASLVYGNAKRYLMYSLLGLFEGVENVSLAVAHPGITFTGITDHYPKLIFALIKHPMKVIFMRPKKACLGILLGLFEKTESNFWIGPRIFDIWGMPKKKRLKSASKDEQKIICENADRIFKKLNSRDNNDEI